MSISLPHLDTVIEPPNPAETPADFNAKAIAAWQDLAELVTEVNAWIDAINGLNDAILAEAAADVLGKHLSGLDTGNATPVTASDTVIEGFGKLQAQVSAAGVHTQTHAAAPKAAPADDDELALVDSAAGFSLKRLTWADLQAALNVAWHVPGVAKSADYTLALTDQGVSIDTTAGVQLPTNAAVALPAGTTLLVTNLGGGAIPITSAGDTLRLAGTDYTGELIVPPYGVARLRKVAATSWYACEQAYPGERAVAWSDVLSRLTFDGVDNGTSFTDANGTLVWTRYGNTVTKTGVKKFGTASGYFDGNGDYLQSGANAALKNLLTQSWTFSCWVYPTVMKDLRLFCVGAGAVGWNNTNGIHVLIGFWPDGALRLSIVNEAMTTSVSFFGPYVETNTWSHIMVQIDRSTGKVALGVNGAMGLFDLPGLGSPSSTPNAAFATIPGENGNATYAFQGYIDDARLAIGVAQYRAPFYNVPAAALPTS